MKEITNKIILNIKYKFEYIHDRLLKIEESGQKDQGQKKQGEVEIDTMKEEQ